MAMCSSRSMMELTIPYTRWPRKKAAPVICNFKNIIDKMSLMFIHWVENSFSSKMTPRSSILGKAFEF